MHLLAAPDKFRGTLTAHASAAAIATGAERAGWTADELPLADGGEGTLAVLGGPNRRTLVSGPLGEAGARGPRAGGGGAPPGGGAGGRGAGQGRRPAGEDPPPPPR